MSKVAPEGETAVGMKPLLKPPDSRGWQGLSKLDCTTEWFFGLKLKDTRVPGSSVMLLGVKLSWPLRPTSTWSFRTPPRGRRSGGDWLGVGAFLASSLKASRVFPLEGL